MVKEEIFNFLSSPEEDNGVPLFSIEEMTVSETVMGNDYLHPNDFLNPNTPGHSAHSDVGSHLGTPLVYLATLDALSLVNSPYYDAISYHLANPPAGSYVEEQNNLLSLQYNRSGQQAPPTFDISTFDQEIPLGQLVLSTNLPGLLYDTLGLGFDPSAFLSQQATPQSFHSANSPSSPNYGQAAGAGGSQLSQYQEPHVPTAPTIEQLPMSFSQLTENNLLAYNQQQTHTDDGLLSTRYNSQLFPVINIQQAPELTAAKTPSLFSNSLANSSVNSLKPKLELNYNLVPNSHLVTLPGSVISDLGHLQPDDSQRRGRKFSQNSSRSRGPLRLPVRDTLLPARSDILSHSEVSNNGSVSINGTTNREKILELALPNVLLKRTQKHPSVYACHLCEKRFTRPYNLKLHLRTHTDERPFICNVCGKAFARQHDRKRHEELHTGEKKFQCKGVLKDGTPYGCGRKFARADALRRHFQTEAGKECIRMLIEEEEFEKGVNAADLLDPLNYGLPSVAILPPPDN